VPLPVDFVSAKSAVSSRCLHSTTFGWAAQPDFAARTV
jgi:hypothetical protein